MRRGELVALTVADVDLDAGVLLVPGSKTGRGRLVPIGTKAVEALDRYIRARARHRVAAGPELWLGLHGPLTGEGVRQMIMVRARQAGVPHIHVHQFRHTAAHRWLLAGGQGQDLAGIAGWTPGSATLGRYGASAAEERARDAHRRLAPIHVVSTDSNESERAVLLVTAWFANPKVNQDGWVGVDFLCGMKHVAIDRVQSHARPSGSRLDRRGWGIRHALGVRRLALPL